MEIFNFQKYDLRTFLQETINDSGLIVPTSHYENAGAEVLVVQIQENGSETISRILSYHQYKFLKI